MGFGGNINIQTTAGGMAGCQRWRWERRLLVCHSLKHFKDRASENVLKGIPRAPRFVRTAFEWGSAEELGGLHCIFNSPVAVSP